MAGGVVAVGVSVKVLVLSQNKVLQCFVEQIIDDLGPDKVQQRFRRAGPRNAPRRCLTWVCAVLRRGQVARALAPTESSERIPCVFLREGALGSRGRFAVALLI